MSIRTSINYRPTYHTLLSNIANTLLLHISGETIAEAVEAHLLQWIRIMSKWKWLTTTGASSTSSTPIRLHQIKTNKIIEYGWRGRYLKKIRSISSPLFYYSIKSWNIRIFYFLYYNIELWLRRNDAFVVVFLVYELVFVVLFFFLETTSFNQSLDAA